MKQQQEVGGRKARVALSLGLLLAAFGLGLGGCSIPPKQPPPKPQPTQKPLPPKPPPTTAIRIFLGAVSAPIRLEVVARAVPAAARALVFKKARRFWMNGCGTYFVETEFDEPLRCCIATS